MSQTSCRNHFFTDLLENTHVEKRSNVQRNESFPSGNSSNILLDKKLPKIEIAIFTMTNIVTCNLYDAILLGLYLYYCFGMIASYVSTLYSIEILF
ncbi:unnamed protein product [Rotaria socialis]